MLKFEYDEYCDNWNVIRDDEMIGMIEYNEDQSDLVFIPLTEDEEDDTISFSHMFQILEFMQENRPI